MKEAAAPSLHRPIPRSSLIHYYRYSTTKGQTLGIKTSLHWLRITLLGKSSADLHLLSFLGVFFVATFDVLMANTFRKKETKMDEARVAKKAATSTEGGELMFDDSREINCGDK